MLKRHTAIKYTILSIHIAKTLLLAINNYLYYEEISENTKQILKIIRDAEFGLKIIVDLCIYPLFLICLNFYVTKYKDQADEFSLKKKILITWIYFIFILNLIYGVFTTTFRILRYLDAFTWEPFMVVSVLSTNFLLPIKDFFLSMTLISLVY